jgi:hypothetical protein
MAQELFGTQQAEPSMISKIGTVLGGFGAGVQGKGQQYLADLQERRAEDEKKRLAAMVKDAKQTYDLLNRGDVNNAQALVQDRMRMISELGGDPTDTARIGSMIESGRIAEAQNELRGFLRPFMPTETIKASELTESGQRVSFDPLSQTTTATDVEGFVAKPEESKAFDRESGFRREFNALPQVKDFATRSAGLGTVLASAQDPSPAGDISLIFAFMKMLDPTSVVREGEFATAQSAGSIPESIWAKYNQALEGTRLAPTVRDDFVDRAQRIYDRASEDFGKTYSRYEAIAKRSGLDPRTSLIDYRFTSPESQLPVSAVEAGVLPEVWELMTDEERALFN